MPAPGYAPNAACGWNVPPEFANMLDPVDLRGLGKEVAELKADVKQLLAMLSPPSSVILTGAEVARYYDQIREGK
jgi:hypothetical protein